MVCEGFIIDFAIMNGSMLGFLAYSNQCFHLRIWKLVGHEVL